MQHPVVIIGSGLAAYMLAKEFRKYDKQTELVIVTASSGDFYSKPQLSTALTKQQTASDLVVQNVDVMREQLNATIITQTHITDIDSSKRMIIGDGFTQLYDKLVLATGACPIMLNIQGNNQGQLVRVNQLEDYAQFQSWLQHKKQIAILGTGLVGCEFMNDLLKANFNLTMVSLESYPLARLVPEPMGKALQAVFVNAGVKWHMEDPAVNIGSQFNPCEVTLQSGEVIRCDGILSAVGLRPKLSLAQAAGVKTHKGIVVDSYLNTSDSHIYALGDCAEVEGRVWQYVAPLLQSARALAKTLAGEPAQVSYPPMPIVIKTPLCPVVSLPPVSTDQGQWHFQGDAPNIHGEFRHADGRLLGFALSGEAVKQRMTLVRQM